MEEQKKRTRQTHINLKKVCKCNYQRRPMSCDNVITLEIQTYKWQPSIRAWLCTLAYTGGCSRAVSYFHTYILINGHSENADWIFIMRFNPLCPSLQSHWASQLWVHSVARTIFSLRDISHPARSFIFPTPHQPPGSAHGTNAAILVNLFPPAMGYGTMNTQI